MAVLGMRGTGDWANSERPKNYREKIFLLFPNSPISLTAVMSRLKVFNTDDPEFTVFEKGLPSQRVTVNGSQTSGDTTIELTGTTPAKVLRKGMSLRNERTDEVLWVTADPSGAFDSITVARGKGSSAAAMNNLDGLYIIGTHHQEGAARPTAISEEVSTVVNYTQIFRNTLDMTNTARATKVRIGDPWQELQRESLEQHAIQRELAYIFGTGVEDTSGAHAERTTKGLMELVTTNVTDFNDAFDIDTWETFLEDVFENGSNEKLALVGNRALTVINKIGRVHGTIDQTPPVTTFGMNMMTYITPYGTLMLRQHPLFSKNATYQDWGIVVDARSLEDRPLVGNGVNRDTAYRENIQNNGDDARVDEWLTESGLGLQHETVHGYFKNASALVP